MLPNLSQSSPLPLRALALLGASGALCALWYWFESRWDRRLFAPKPGQRCVNHQAADAKAWLLQNPDTQILDVRSAREFRDGCIPGAIHISLGDPRFSDQLASWNRNKPVLVYCAGGYRSRKAVERLQKLGFTQIHHLHRGYLSWKWNTQKPSAP